MTDAISWRNPKVLRVLAVVFVAGALSGVVTYRLWRMITRPQNSVSVSSGGMDLRDKKIALEYLKSQLDLTPVQTEQVAAIIDDYKRYYGNIEDQFEEVRATGKNKIIKVLDPEQRAKFDKLAGRLK